MQVKFTGKSCGIYEREGELGDENLSTPSKLSCKSHDTTRFRSRPCNTCGVGFSQLSSNACLVDTQSGIFYWSACTMVKIKEIKDVEGKAECSKKKLKRVAYMLELVLEILLAPTEDVSESAGYESCIGIN